MNCARPREEATPGAKRATRLRSSVPKPNSVEATRAQLMSGMGRKQTLDICSFDSGEVRSVADLYDGRSDPVRLECWAVFFRVSAGIPPSERLSLTSLGTLRLRT